MENKKWLKPPTRIIIDHDNINHSKHMYTYIQPNDQHKCDNA